MTDEITRLRDGLAKAEQDLADAERVQTRAGFGKELVTEVDHPYIDRLRSFRDTAKVILDRAIASSALPTAITQEERARQGTPRKT